MASNRSSASASGSRRPSMPPTEATSRFIKIRKTSAYGPSFEQHLTNHKIYLPFPKDRPTPPKPNNLDESRRLLSSARLSLSPSRFTESVFENFQQKSEQATFENEVMTTVIPIICGDAGIPNKQNVLFTELAPVTSTYDDVVRPKPDFFDGTRPGDMDEKIRNPRGDMYPLIIPTKHASVPVTPNFFLEAKAPSGDADVLKRQACYNGAYGTRAMHALQNYGEEEAVVYDGNAYTYSSTYHAGTLRLYAHHPTAPTTPGGRPEYHMTQVRAFAMTSDRNVFVQGSNNIPGMRGTWRKGTVTDFIQAANARKSTLVQFVAEQSPHKDLTL